MVRKRGGTLREAADAIITAVASGGEEPLLAIEYCGALPAGNQAWQRSGRAYSFGRAQIPFLYVAEIGGYELDAQRGKKAPRLPNPAVPFSYLSYSSSQHTPVVPVFIASPGAGEMSRREYADVFGDSELAAFMRAILFNEDTSAVVDALSKKVLAFVRLRASSRRSEQCLSPEEWSEAYNALKGKKTLVEYLLGKKALSWRKTAYIKALTDSAKQLMALASRYAIGLTARDLPMCIVPGERRAEFAQELKALYARLPDGFTGWLGQRKPLTICWVMGFKPRGDDARPDRGLPPLARMLIGAREELLTVVYGPAPPATWPLLKNAPGTLVERNGLWEAILEVSDAVLVDSATDEVGDHAYLRQHWASAIPEPANPAIRVEPAPTRIGENVTVHEVILPLS